MKLILLVFGMLAATGTFAASPTISPDITMPSDFKQLKPGLWETTRRSESNAPSVDLTSMDTSKLDPAARERVEAVLKRQAAEKAARGNGPKVTTHVKQECITQEILDKRQLSLDPERRNGRQEECPPTLKSRTANRLVVASECSVRGQSFNVELTFEVKSREETISRITSNGNYGGKEVKRSDVVSSRWLGSDCGNVKPKV